MHYMSDNNCYATVVGGLGNQLFIVAAAYAYAKKTNRKLFIDPTQWTASQGKYPFEYQRSIFQNFKYKCSLDVPTIISEQRFNYDELPNPNPNYSASLHGYFQSLKYFENYTEDFIKKLSLPEVNTSFIKKKNVAFHIRRGDYLKFPIHYICNTEYFKDRFREFAGYQINVFTDSPDIVLKEFENEEFNLIETSSELNDLTMMSKHDNIVCSNSSFSWWAALLGKMNKVIVPDKWFFGIDCEDIYLPNMSRINI